MRKIVKNIRKSIAIKRCARVLMAVSISLSTISMDAVISASAGNDNVILTSIGDGSENLALNKTAAASTNEGTAGRYPNAGVDGDINTRWASAAGVDGSGIDETWYQVDLGSETEVHKIVIVWESRPNKFQMQVSLDGKEWKDVGEVVDNGFYTSNPAKTNTVEFDTVNARYVRMQGIQRRRKTDEDGGASNRTGYSIKEFEIYGPAWDDSRYISEYLTTLNIKSRVSKNFTLPVKDDDYGITITWESDNDAITVSQDGKATVTRSENDVKALLTATVKRGEKSDTKKFEVTVVSNTGKEYEFSPIPQSVTYNSGSLEISETVNLVFEDDVETNVKDKYIDILEENDIAFQESESINSQNMNLIVGTQNDSGVVEDYFENIEYNKELSTNCDEGYVLDVNIDDNVVAILGSDDLGTLYGGYTLLDIIEQSEGVIREVRVEDYPDTQFRGFIEGFYGSWSHTNRKSLMEFCGRYKMNTYIYGPKNDEYHYGKWKEMYPEDKLNELKELVEVGKRSGVEFVWAAHVGGHTDLSDTDIESLEKKFDQLYDVGVRQFALFFDDSATNNTRLVEYMNKIQTEYVEKKEGVKPLIFCPQYYRKQGANESYLRNLAKFDKDIQIMWTGDYVVSEINQSVIDYIVNIIQRPVFIWWNWPVNDLGRSNLMHLGPSVLTY